MNGIEARGFHCGRARRCLPPGAAQDAVADFYKGKQISIMVGFTPGGSSSLYAQALGRHMGRYLPGSPSFIVQHVPGAGGLVLANNMANTVTRDGTAFAITGRTAAIEPLLGNKNAKFDGRQLSWIGTANVEYTTCSLWHTARAKTLQDAMAMEAVVGGSGADATEVIFPKAANKLVGTRFKIVLGYPGSTEILLAMERGEVDGFCGIGWTFLKLRKGDWLRDKKLNILYQMSIEKHPELPHVPAIIDYAKTTGGPEGVRVSVRAAGDGAPVLRAARRAGRAGRGVARGVRPHAQGPAVPGRGREDGRRGAAHRRRAHPGAGGAHLRLAAGRDRPCPRGGGVGE